jgi:hypothetical protein
VFTPGGTVLAQTAISETKITVGGEEVVSTPTCSNGQIPKLSGGSWVCGTDETVAGANTGLCTLYSLTGQVPDGSLGCPAQQVKYIFATNAHFEGKLDALVIPGLGAVVNADLWCGGEAVLAGLDPSGSPTYLAWIADNNPANDPDSRFTKAGPTTWYTLPSGKIVAIGWDDLTDGQLEWGIGEDAAGANITTAPTAAWTNVNRDGTQRSITDGHCVNWTDDEFTYVKKSQECTYSGSYANPTQVGFRGSTSLTSTSQSWTQGGTSCCDDDGGFGAGKEKDSRRGRLICVQQ